MATIKGTTLSGNQEIDGILGGTQWVGEITYAFPDSASDYPYNFSEATGFSILTDLQKIAVNKALEGVESFTNLNITYVGTGTGDLMFGNSPTPSPTAWAYYPGSGNGGDAWFSNNYGIWEPYMGTYGWETHFHEIGHTLGLKHAYSGTPLPAEHMSLNYSVMIRPGDGTMMPTTFMINDILALQYMYGADYSDTTNHTYTWNPLTGEYYINGIGQGQPYMNYIFHSIWDGGGIDTYDMSNYQTSVKIDLGPGSYSIHYGQLSNKGIGTVFNAYLFNNDTRSLIENAVGGSGADEIIGNSTDNVLDGRAGNDIMLGGLGNDTFVFGQNYGQDIVADFKFAGADKLDLSSMGLTFDQIMSFATQVGFDTVFNFGSDVLILKNVNMSTLTSADFGINAPPPPPPVNHNPTDLTLSGTTVLENQAGAILGQIGVTDPDGDTLFNFSLSDSRFEVVNSTLKLKNGVSLDYELQSTINLNVTVTDQGGLSYTELFNISVVDVVESVPGRIINGTNKADTLTGTSGADAIFGKNGTDLLNGLGGDDTLTGGNGSDVFRFDPNFGNDTITDFRAKPSDQDRIQFSKAVFADYNVVVSAASQSDDSVVITHSPGNTLVIENITLAQLTPDYFLFV
jgi:Ca2+-binding RTX toxin-like protein